MGKAEITPTPLRMIQRRINFYKREKPTTSIIT